MRSGCCGPGAAGSDDRGNGEMVVFVGEVRKIKRSRRKFMMSGSK